MARPSCGNSARVWGVWEVYGARALTAVIENVKTCLITFRDEVHAETALALSTVDRVGGVCGVGWL